jgi:hypothetical protein
MRIELGQTKYQLALLCVCMTPITSHAAPETPTPFYLGASAGYGQTALSKPPTASTFERNGTAWSIFSGYQGKRLLSPEIGFVRMHNVKATAGATASDTVEPWFGYIAAKASTLNHSPLRFFAKLGAANAYGKETLVIDGQAKQNHQHKIVAYGALGINYTINPRLSLDISASSTTKKGTVPRMSVGSIGIIYHF